MNRWLTQYKRDVPEVRDNQICCFGTKLKARSWLAKYQEYAHGDHTSQTDNTDNTYKKHITTVLSVHKSHVKDIRNRAQYNTENERWNPDLISQGYVWCQDCQFFNGFNCNSSDNRFKTVEKQPAVARKCQWYKVNSN